jgi:hypothetical protein
MGKDTGQVETDLTTTTDHRALGETLGFFMRGNRKTVSQVYYKKAI